MTENQLDQHPYESLGVGKWRTCKVCGQGANATIHREDRGMTYSGKSTVPRREVIDHAKRIVLTYGPDNVLDHSEECVLAMYGYDDDFPVAEVAREAERQARRVYEFLGYSTPY